MQQNIYFECSVQWVWQKYTLINQLRYTTIQSPTISLVIFFKTIDLFIASEHPNPWCLTLSIKAKDALSPINVSPDGGASKQGTIYIMD